MTKRTRTATHYPNLDALKTRMTSVLGCATAGEYEKRFNRPSAREMSTVLAGGAAKIQTFVAIATALNCSEGEIISYVAVFDSKGNVTKKLPYHRDHRMEMWPGLGGIGNLYDATRRLIHSWRKSIADIGDLPTPRAITRFESLREYWRATATMAPGMEVEISGTLCPNAPLMIANPSGTRSLHELFRVHPDADHPELWSSNVSITAGQLVWHLPPIGDFTIICLCESIVRNHIVIIVKSELLHGFGPCACEATVRGQVVPIQGFAAAIDMTAWRVSSDDLLPKPLAILVDPRRAPRAGIALNQQRQPRHLDGDIFALLKHRGTYQLKTRIVDLGWHDDVMAQTVALREDCRQELLNGDGSIVFMYDDPRGDDDRIRSAAIQVNAEGDFDYLLDSHDEGEYRYPTTDRDVNRNLAIQDSSKEDRERELVKQSIGAANLIIDVGCGEGAHFQSCDFASPDKRSIIGIEPDAHRAAIASEHARSLCYAKARVVFDDASFLTKLETGLADHILCIQVLGHTAVTDCRMILEQCDRVLKEGGALTLCVPVFASDHIVGDDYLHVVDFRRSPSDPAYRRSLQKSQFDQLARQPKAQELPVRSFELPSLAHAKLNRMPM